MIRPTSALISHSKESAQLFRRQDFGDRDGSLIEHIREYQTFYLNDEKWKDHLTRQGGPEAWAEDHASREAFLTEIIPTWSSIGNLSRLEQERRPVWRPATP